tara:strand:+ start:835 stop:1053 length:219 start_codon:yes stop_codon:yes gene_type:complete
MKEKVITIKPKGITTKQWSNLLLELNLIRKAWRPYGVDLQLSAPGLKNILKWGTKTHGSEKTGPTSNSLEQN